MHPLTSRLSRRSTDRTTQILWLKLSRRPEVLARLQGPRLEQCRHGWVLSSHLRFLPLAVGAGDCDMHLWAQMHRRLLCEVCVNLQLTRKSASHAHVPMQQEVATRNLGFGCQATQAYGQRGLAMQYLPKCFVYDRYTIDRYDRITIV